MEVCLTAASYIHLMSLTHKVCVQRRFSEVPLIFEGARGRVFYSLSASSLAQTDALEHIFSVLQPGVKQTV